MPITTRLTEMLGLTHPVLLGPMAFASGGRLAAAVSDAGGLGIIGGGYGDADWLEREFEAAGDATVGCGFITWSLARRPELLDIVLDKRPRVMMLSFGDAAPFARRVTDAGIPLVFQVQSFALARDAIDLGAAVIVAQGAEAGGHGRARATMTLVPEIADLCAARAPETPVVAAGGIADGRGLAAALMLGADGVLMGTRFWASAEALVHPRYLEAVLAADGDATVQTRTVDVARGLGWPEEFPGRVLRNAYTERWLGREDEIIAVAAEEGSRLAAATQAGDAANGCLFTGEAAGLVRDAPPAGDIVRRVVAEAEELLAK